MANLEIRKLNTSGTVIMTWTLPRFDNFSFDINTPVTPTPLPEEDSSENVLIKVEGNSTALVLSWVVKPDSSNQITGSGFTGNSATIFEQLLGMKNQFRPTSIDDAYEIAIVDGGSDQMVWNGTVTKMSARFTSMEPVSARVTMNFLEGNVVTVYAIDTPKAPTNFTATGGGSSGEIDLTWTNPTDTGTGTPALSGYRVQYKTGNNDWTTVDYTPSGTSRTITGLTGGSTYTVRVAASTSNGVGKFSKELTAVATS